MDLANKMAYNADEISLRDYLYAQSSNIDYYEFPDVDVENLETDNESMLHSLALANQSREIHENSNYSGAEIIVYLSQLLIHIRHYRKFVMKLGEV